MGLDFGGVKNNLFEHSKEYSQGEGKQRKATASVVVALDGTGDFEDIQEALNSLSPSGGSIFIKEGTYNLTTELLIKTNNVLIQGTGKGTKLLADTSNNCIDTNGKSYILIRDLYLYGHDDNIAIEVSNTSTYITIENNYIEHFTHGVATTGDSIIVKGNYILNGTNFGIYVSTGNYGVFVNNIISSIIVGNATGHGIILNNLNYCVIAGNIIYSCDGDAIKLDLFCDYCNVANNICYLNNRGININGASCNSNVVIGNVCRSNITNQILDTGTGTLPNGATGTTNLAIDDLNIIA